MSSGGLDRSALIDRFKEEMREWSTWTVVFHSAIAQRLGLNATDHKCLDVLFRAGPVTPGYLAELTGLTTGAITGVIDRLEQAGLVRRERDPGDRRRVLIHVETEAAKSQIAPVFESLSLDRKLTQLLSRYSEGELALLLDFAVKAKEFTRQAIAELRGVATGRREDQ